MNRGREIAKFACGAQAFHAFGHALLWALGTRMKVAGIKVTREMNAWATVINLITAVGLGLYAWPRAARQLGTRVPFAPVQERPTPLRPEAV